MSERPWILHDGMGRPVPDGTVVDCELRNGVLVRGVVIGSNVAVAPDGTLAKSKPRNIGNAWVWNSGPAHLRCCEVVKYRLHIDPQAEADRVNARQTLFHGWIKEAETLPYCVPPEPVEPRETVR